MGSRFVRVLFFGAIVILLPALLLTDGNDLCINANCSQNCRLSPEGPECFCDEGFELQNDSKTCLEQLNMCPGNDFRCKNGRCILSSWKCDKRNDCGDNSDEEECPVIASCPTKDQFLCGGGECIPILWRCDGENDCSDNSDEAECHSTSCEPETQLRCDHGRCIPVSWACDGTWDCFDGTDERNCNYLCNNANCSQKCRISPEGPECFCDEGFELQNDSKTCLEQLNMCPGNDFRCKNGRCILSSWKCDKRNDCGDSSDEEECPAIASCPTKDQFLCGGGECIPKLWLCDGENDCSDNSDEAECHSTSCDPETQLRCDHGQCIPASWACDGTPDCFDSTDEMNCIAANTCEGRFDCGNGVCIPKLWRCDGKRDCRDGRDEVECPLTACEDKSQFRCGNGQCIPKQSVCDGVFDCNDRDDERNCDKTLDT